MKFEVRLTYDEGGDCETCGMSYGEGYDLWLGDELVSQKIPYASCFDSSEFKAQDVINDILNHLGVDAEVEVNA